MSYIINGTRPLIFCANPRTGSTAIAKALKYIGAQVTESGHHGPPRFIPDNAIVFQVVRHHLEVINSFWWKSKPTGNFESFVDLVCSGGYKQLAIPMYGRPFITHTILYQDLPDSFEWVCMMAGIEPPDLQKTPSHTQLIAREMFSPHLAQKVWDVYGEEMSKFGFDFLP